MIDPLIAFITLLFYPLIIGIILIIIHYFIKIMRISKSKFTGRPIEPDPPEPPYKKFMDTGIYIFLSGEDYSAWNLNEAREKWLESIKYFDKAIETDPGYATAWKYKSLALNRLGHKDESKIASKRAEDLESKGP